MFVLTISSLSSYGGSGGGMLHSPHDVHLLHSCAEPDEPAGVEGRKTLACALRVEELVGVGWHHI